MILADFHISISVPLRTNFHVNKKQDNTTKNKTNDNKVSEKLYNCEKNISFYALPENNTTSLEECYPHLSRWYLISSVDLNSRYFLTQILQNSPDTLY